MRPGCPESLFKTRKPAAGERLVYVNPETAGGRGRGAGAGAGEGRGRESRYPGTRGPAPGAAEPGAARPQVPPARAATQAPTRTPTRVDADPGPVPD